MKCHSVKCQSQATRFVHWPAQPVQLCDECAQRALGVSGSLGFEVMSEPLEQWGARLALGLQVADAAQRLKGEPCRRCGGNGADPEQSMAPCGECGGRGPF